MTRFDATTTTTCGYCGVGCRLEAHRSDGWRWLVAATLAGVLAIYAFSAFAAVVGGH